LVIDVRDQMSPPKTITLAFTGASGMPYGVRLLELLLASGNRVYLLYSQPAQMVAHQEMQFVLPSRTKDAEELFGRRFNAAEGQLRVFGREDWFAPVASGSNPPDAMVVCPCTMGTLAAIAGGLSQKLIERAADVMLKEKRKLILVPRETPLSSIHLENMLKLAQNGVVILPPNPGFYHHPRTVEDMVDFVVARILDHLDVAHTLMPRWGEKDNS
jgi:4-hydroxy-3-polyprenylbenzoate decarboxylase